MEFRLQNECSKGTKFKYANSPQEALICYSILFEGSFGSTLVPTPAPERMP